MEAALWPDTLAALWCLRNYPAQGWQEQPMQRPCSHCSTPHQQAGAMGDKKMTPKQLQILRHMLGIDDPYLRDPKPWRDYFCANPDDMELVELASLGMVEKYSEHGSYFWYRTTDLGRAAALKSQRAIRHPKARRVYVKFLEISDCFSELTFKEFLTDKQFEETRHNA